MRERWKQVGLILLSALAVAAALNAAGYLAYKLIGGVFIAIYFTSALASFVGYLAAVRWIERRQVTEFSPAALPALAGGLGGGIALFSVVMAILWVAGVYQPHGWGGANRLGLAFAFWLAVAAQEEIIYRGLVFRLLSKVAGTWGALLLSAVFFGATHAMNPGATAAGLNSVALAGVLLGALYVVSGRLWLPIGVHWGWNFAEGSLFGTAVSGSDVGGSLLAGKLSGPALLTGGQFGPEASIVAVLILLPCTVYCVWRIAARGRSEPPIWRAKKAPSPSLSSPLAPP